MVTSLLSKIQSSYGCWPPREPLCYLTPIILYLINTLYTAHLSFRRKGRKEEKTIQKNKKHRQKFTAKEKLTDGMKIGRYILEPLTTI